VSYLLDTNVVSELRKRDRANPHVRTWFETVESHDLYLSVLTVGELRRGIDLLGQRDAISAAAIKRWLRTLLEGFGDRILPVDRTVAEEWGRLTARPGIAPIDGLFAATARVHRLTLVTRNLKDVRHADVDALNPFTAAREMTG
jgi:predicted nucleic acid-binding protein